MGPDRTDVRRRTLAVAIACLVLAAGVPATTAGADGGMTSETIGDTQVNPDSVLLDVALHGDGSATWRVVYRIRLTDENRTAAFESLRRDIRSNRSEFTDRFADRLRRTVRAAENATGREMSIENVTVRTARQEIGQRYGIVVYRFEWHRFAVTRGDRLRAGDAIAGLFLDAETTLEMSWPDEYRLVSVDPQPDTSSESAVVWRGERTFAADEPRLVLTSAPPTETTTAGVGDGGSGDGGGGGDGGAGGDGGDGGAGDGEPGGGLPTGALAAAVLVALALAGGALVWLRRGTRDEPAVRTESGTTPDEDGEADGGPTPDEELLSNEERVLRLLEEHGGRIKQQTVASELDWTDAKTSQVVGNLRENGEVDVFRLGRENVLTLPDEDDI